MALPQGFLGTEADILIDLVLVSFVLILPLLMLSWYRVRQADYLGHKRLQLGLAAVLGVAVALFEIDLTLSGGIEALTRGSAYYGTVLLNSIIYGHTLVAIVTTVVWVVLIVRSLRRFASPPQPNDFSASHRRWGRVGMLGMMGSGLSALPLYYFGFVA